MFSGVLIESKQKGGALERLLHFAITRRGRKRAFRGEGSCIFLFWFGQRGHLTRGRRGRGSGPSKAARPAALAENPPRGTRGRQHDAVLTAALPDSVVCFGVCVGVVLRSLPDAVDGYVVPARVVLQDGGCQLTVYRGFMAWEVMAMASLWTVYSTFHLSPMFAAAMTSSHFLQRDSWRA